MQLSPFYQELFTALNRGLVMSVALIVPSALGGVLGYSVCKAVMSENGMMGTYFDMPDWSAATPALCYPIIAGTVLLLALISFLSVRAQLRGTAADALRPYTPKKMKKSILEKLPFFSKMSFATKWNARSDAPQ